MPGRPNGSLAITVALAVAGAAAAFSLAALVVTPGNPVRAVAEAMIVVREPARQDVRVAAHREEPEYTGSVILPLRRND
jgi:hypothetical protein